MGFGIGIWDLEWDLEWDLGLGWDLRFGISPLNIRRIIE